LRALHGRKDLPHAGALFPGEAAAPVVGVFVRSDAVNSSKLHIDQQLMDAVGRMGGHTPHARSV
jgi:hypothetical protein